VSLRIRRKIRALVPLHTADALILRTYKLGEADRIVVFLTRDRGKKRGVAKGARRSRSRFAAALEPLTEARVAYFEREGRELVGLNYAEPVRSPLMLAMDAGSRAGMLDAGEEPCDALGYLGYFAELIDEWAQEADADDRLYRLGVSMLDALSAGAPVEPLARYFEYWLLRLQGVYPETRDAFSDEARAFLTASARATPHEIGRLPQASGVMRELEHVHRTLITMHLEKTLKSDRVLREIRRHH
jgi:DNA repair protein RecO (recombination protein O)